jgi:ketosteroid isomerase-like protein
MSTANHPTKRPTASGEPLTHEEAARIGRAYVDAYNQRDLEAMLSLQDDEIESSPSRLFENRGHRGHAGVRAWWAEMEASGRWYEVHVREVRVLGPDRAAALGEIWDRGELVSPWGVIFRVRDGLIVESHSYLSDGDLLAELDLL